MRVGINSINKQIMLTLVSIQHHICPICFEITYVVLIKMAKTVLTPFTDVGYTNRCVRNKQIYSKYA